MSVALRLDGLVAGYAQPVAGPISLEVGTGEAVGIWGPNGSGKSTLLKSVLGAASVFAGTLARPAGGGLSYQRQQPVRPEGVALTAAEYLRYNDATADPLPERLRPLLSRRVDRLSGGQFQLLAVWAVLSRPAGLVLLDEPTNNLDPHGVELLSELIARRGDGYGLLVVSHERRFLERCCTRILELG